MRIFGKIRQRTCNFCAGAVLTTLAFAAPDPVTAQVTAFKQGVAETAALDADIAAFYRENGYDAIWTGTDADDMRRREALIQALSQSELHGLPAARYEVDALIRKMKSVQGPRALGQLEVELSRVFLKYARDLQTGMLIPSKIDSAMVRQVPYRDRTAYLKQISTVKPASFLRSLKPATPEYTALLTQKIRMEAQLARGGWGPRVSAKSLKPGQAGNAVVALRDRMIAMGYLTRSNAMTYDQAMQEAVRRFQAAHGLPEDGVAGAGTLAEINTPMQKRLQALHVAMERERWMNRERGQRHILVNLPDFTAKVLDDNKVTFSTRAVIGANRDDRPTPEFSDVMEFMVINPSWYVPRSIITKEYLPALQRNPNAVRHLEITDRRGRRVNRGAVNFSRYNARNFPYSMRQPPSKSNALGLVKFMFPNKYNIYLHDTPAKNLFSREVRAYSHGCVRLGDPFDFAYTLLAKQSDTPKETFHGHLRTGQEARVNLVAPVPVHIIYRTAFTDARGQMQYRKDIYGRDAKVWRALERAGVALPGVQG